MEWIAGGWIVMNLLAYASFGLDKQRARSRKWRISEKTLLWLTVCGGAVGGWRGMKDFRHKTHKNTFRILIPLFIILQVVLLYFIVFRWIDPTWNTMSIMVGAVLLQAVVFLLLRRR